MAKEKNGLDLLWKNFEKSGSVESYLAYFQGKQGARPAGLKKAPKTREKAGRARK